MQVVTTFIAHTFFLITLKNKLKTRQKELSENRQVTCKKAN